MYIETELNTSYNYTRLQTYNPTDTYAQTGHYAWRQERDLRSLTLFPSSPNRQTV